MGEAWRTWHVLRHDLGAIPPMPLAAARVCPGVAQQASCMTGGFSGCHFPVDNRWELVRFQSTLWTL